MSKNGPNKTVGAWQKKNPFPIRHREQSDFMKWVFEQAAAGRSFPTTEEAETAFREETRSDVVRTKGAGEHG